MKCLILFDSQFGNTEKISQAIARGLEQNNEVIMLRVSQASAGQLSGYEMLVAGSPTQGFRATKAISALLKALPRNALSGVRVAAFDTRFTEEKIKESAKFLPALVKMFGYAAEPLARQLVEKGGRQIIAPEGFFVGDTEGPLLEGELERAEAWGKSLEAK
jgi:flavodoxin